MEGNPGESAIGLNRGLCPGSCVSTKVGPWRRWAGDTGHCVTVLCEAALCPVRWKRLLSHILDRETGSDKAQTSGLLVPKTGHTSGSRVCTAKAPASTWQAPAHPAHARGPQDCPSSVLVRKCPPSWRGTGHTRSQRVKYGRTHPGRNLWAETSQKTPRKLTSVVIPHFQQEAPCPRQGRAGCFGGWGWSGG